MHTMVNKPLSVCPSITPTIYAMEKALNAPLIISDPALSAAGEPEWLLGLVGLPGGLGRVEVRHQGGQADEGDCQDGGEDSWDIIAAVNY